ncbi:hypothetical protein [Parasynechococcus sp.]|uniref:hypothetical protein n=1 Tax=Parasynechococcus sp. TaxID=3101203 RepID=UPI0037038534
MVLPVLGGPSAKAAEPEEVRSDRDTIELVAQDTTPEQADSDEQDSEQWRLYLDLYGFLPIENEGTVKLDGNSNTGNLSLSDILENVSSIATLRAGIEYGRFGLQTGVFHGAVDFNDGMTERMTYERSRIRKLTGKKVDRSLKLRGDIEGDFHLDQTLIDIALRYRAGDIQRAKMDEGSFSFVGFAGARIVDGTIKADVDIDLSSSYEGPVLKNERSKEIDLGDSWSHTWVQPLVGMQATYAFSPDWQAFVYADAAGFGLAGKKDLSGNAQAGIAYAVGNSTQVSLSYKVYGLEYAAHGNDNGYKAFSHGPNIGLRFVFD